MPFYLGKCGENKDFALMKLVHFWSWVFYFNPDLSYGQETCAKKPVKWFVNVICINKNTGKGQFVSAFLLKVQKYLYYIDDI